MSEGPQSPPEPLTPAQVAFRELTEKKRSLAQQIASIRAQLRAVEQAQKPLEPHARGDLVRLEFTKNDAVFLGAVCYHFTARCPELGVETRDLINGLGDDLMQAAYDQNADFAQRVNRFVYGRNAADTTDEGPPSTSNAPATRSAPRLPKKARPYLRYSDPQLDAAVARSKLGSTYDYVAEDFVRLHLGRAALLEMFRRPRHVKLTYAYLMKKIDTLASGLGCNLFRGGGWEREQEDEPTRSRPYERFSEPELREGLKRIGLSRGQVRFAYGLLTVSLRRRTLLHLYRAKSQDPGIAYLLKVLDERETPSGS